VSLQARAAGLFLRLTVRWPLQSALGTPRILRVTRRTFNGGSLIFGRPPSGTSLQPDGARGEWLIPDGRVQSVVVLYLHGGGYVGGSPAGYRSLTGAIARRTSARVYVPNYRLAPEHRFPAAVDDSIAAYLGLLESGVSASHIVVAGDSAGGGLTLSTALALRERGLPLPAGLVMLSPWVDLAGTGESHRTNASSDDVVVDDGSNALARAYLGDRALDDAAASGLYAVLEGLPPMLIHASRSEVLRDDAVRLAEKARVAGVEATLRLWDAVPHVWQLFPRLPETRESLDEIAAFVARVCR